ncbi:MAG: heme-binding protein [Gammaproteobacteria bacterium]|jgi:hypothetical protein|nr:heme-binding protein [Gammaproteobacteria bacterium]MBT6041908.1 heme-binding protein [Gammaproteobacteria bacterium]
MNIYIPVKKVNKPVFSLLALLVLPVFIMSGDLAMAIEEPDFEVIKQEGDIEYRRYSPFIIAQTLVKEAQSRTDSSNVGFRRLFSYITGDNTGQEKIEMTAPVIQQEGQKKGGEKIAMTAPVQQAQSDEGWLVSFVLPLNYTMETAPIPDSPDITLRQVAARIMAVLTFSGRWSEKNVSKHQEKLLASLASSDVKIIGEPEFAAYNAPFALPFMRRNEVMIEVEME